MDKRIPFHYSTTTLMHSSTQQIIHRPTAVSRTRSLPSTRRSHHTPRFPRLSSFPAVADGDSETDTESYVLFAFGTTCRQDLYPRPCKRLVVSRPTRRVRRTPSTTDNAHCIDATDTLASNTCRQKHATCAYEGSGEIGISEAYRREHHHRLEQAPDIERRHPEPVSTAGKTRTMPNTVSAATAVFVDGQAKGGLRSSILKDVSALQVSSASPSPESQSKHRGKLVNGFQGDHTTRDILFDV